jgi:hypothetical protein
MHVDAPTRPSGRPEHVVDPRASWRCVSLQATAIARAAPASESASEATSKFVAELSAERVFYRRRGVAGALSGWTPGYEQPVFVPQSRHV